MKSNVIIFGTKFFNNTINEIHEHLNFTPYFFTEEIDKKILSNSNIVIIDCDILKNIKIKKIINVLKGKISLLIDRPDNSDNSNYTGIITRPFNLTDLNNKITWLLSSSKFNKNSTIKIKEYILDKNEKKLKKGNLYIALTEREIQLLDLLCVEKKSLSKNVILSKVCKYATDADTHTVETHIYRLRKKIKEQFLDDNLIINNQDGYLI